VAELGTSKSGGTISQLGCSTSVACHGSPIKQQQQPPLAIKIPNIVVFMAVFYSHFLHEESKMLRLFNVPQILYDTFVVSVFYGTRIGCL
jgi:hypothetical protein